LLVFALSLFAVSPALHDALHEDAASVATEGCAVDLFTQGVSLPVGDIAAKPIQYADIEMDLASYRVWRGGREIHLSPTEFKLLRRLLERPEQVVTRHDLRIAAWPRNIHVGPRTIDVHVGRLRRALSMGTETNLVRTIRSVGWALSSGSADKAEPPIEAGVKTEPAPQSA